MRCRSGHKGHIIQPQTSILSWKLSLTSWKCWVVWVILLSNLLQPTRTIRMLPILSRNSSFRQKDPRKISFLTLIDLNTLTWGKQVCARTFRNANCTLLLFKLFRRQQEKYFLTSEECSILHLLIRLFRWNNEVLELDYAAIFPNVLKDIFFKSRHDW